MPGGARVSDSAVGRNRISSLARYHRNRPQNHKVQKAYRDAMMATRPFVGWDGEGYDAYIASADGEIEIDHRYLLFGASTGAVKTSLNLGTTECLLLILEVEAENPDVYHVGFSFEYDVNMILKDLKWRSLNLLKAYGSCRYVDPKTGQRFRIEHIPHKWFRVSSEGVSATIYDCFGFFHCGYLAALKKYGIGSEDKLARIARGKAARGTFRYADIENIKDYWLAEISLLPPLLDSIRTAVYDGGYRISEWHGPGALAAYLLRDRGVIRWHSKNVPTEVKFAIRAAYAGGRFTGALCGLYLGPIYTADINSAYVYATSLLPRMDNGRWVRQNPNTIDPGNLARFGLYRIEFDIGRGIRDSSRKHRIPEPPGPLFHRGKDGVLRWPEQTNGWYWTPEAQLVVGQKYARVVEAWIFNDDGSSPFRFVNEAYNRRVILQHQDNPAEKAYKWSLAAMYGAFARRVGWDKKTRKPPKSHELAWAGFITSWCRAAVWGPAYRAWSKGEGRGLISIDTDGITATVPFNRDTLPNGVGEGLGQWKLEEWTGILQWQNGIYWLRDAEGNWKDPKSRGIPKGSVPFALALDAIQRMDYSQRPYVHPKLTLSRTRFIGYRQALNGQLDRWRKWLTDPVEIMMGGTASGKACHLFALCAACSLKIQGQEPESTDIKNLHTIVNTSIDSLLSAPHKLPWLEEQPDLPDGFIADEFKFIVRDEDM